MLRSLTTETTKNTEGFFFWFSRFWRDECLTTSAFAANLRCTAANF